MCCASSSSTPWNTPRRRCSSTRNPERDRIDLPSARGGRLWGDSSRSNTAASRYRVLPLPCSRCGRYPEGPPGFDPWRRCISPNNNRRHTCRVGARRKHRHLALRSRHRRNRPPQLQRPRPQVRPRPPAPRCPRIPRGRRRAAMPAAAGAPAKPHRHRTPEPHA